VSDSLQWYSLHKCYVMATSWVEKESRREISAGCRLEEGRLQLVYGGSQVSFESNVSVMLGGSPGPL
jgi:hypothetical protein